MKADLREHQARDAAEILPHAADPRALVAGSIIVQTPDGRWLTWSGARSGGPDSGNALALVVAVANCAARAEALVTNLLAATPADRTEALRVSMGLALALARRNLPARRAVCEELPKPSTQGDPP